MSTWTTIAARLRRRFHLLDDQGERLSLLFSFPDRPGLTQRVYVELAEAFGRPWLLIEAAVGALGQLDPVEALRHNATLALGALALCGDIYLVRQGLPADAPGAELERAIEELGHEAARLRADRAPEAAHGLFAAYID